ncbi:MAG TPA: hypothetical protein VIP11_09090 [Gemmatimonadaceae bacterium]
MRIAVAIGLAFLTMSASLADAQGRGGGRGRRLQEAVQGFQLADSPELAEAINALLADDGPHMRMAPRRPVTPADQFRAKQTVLAARDALGKYADVTRAEEDGYVKFLPWIEQQSVFHYNNVQHIAMTGGRFDPTKPVSLLYKKDAKGTMQLIGAMYSAMPDASPDELDARLPLSVAHWHEHVDFCGPQAELVRSGQVKIDGPTTAKWLKITSRETCDAAGGRFVPRLFGWMAHVYMFASEDPRIIWGGEHGAMDVHSHKP